MMKSKSLKKVRTLSWRIKLRCAVSTILASAKLDRKFVIFTIPQKRAFATECIAGKDIPVHADTRQNETVIEEVNASSFTRILQNKNLRTMERKVTR